MVFRLSRAEDNSLRRSEISVLRPLNAARFLSQELQIVLGDLDLDLVIIRSFSDNPMHLV